MIGLDDAGIVIRPPACQIGPNGCHGPASWCDDCGDVGEVCPHPTCEAHHCPRCGVLELIRDYACEVCHLDDRIQCQREEFEKSLERHGSDSPSVMRLARRIADLEAERKDVLATRARRHARPMPPIVWPGWGAPL